MKRSRYLLAALLGAGLVLLTACGSTDKTTVITGSASDHGISVSGQGIVYAAPDVADLTLGVQVRDRTVAGARATAADAQTAIVASLKANGVASEDVRTVQFSVGPQYDTNQGVQTLRGYQVTNVLSVRIRKIADAGKIIDDAAAAGGNSTLVRDISFSILDTSKLQDQARELAVKDAKQRADTLARTGGVKLGKPITINESGTSTPQPLALAAAPRASDASTPIESGQLRVQINVNVLFAVE